MSYNVVPFLYQNPLWGNTSQIKTYKIAIILFAYYYILHFFGFFRRSTYEVDGLNISGLPFDFELLEYQFYLSVFEGEQKLHMYFAYSTLLFKNRKQ